MKFKPMLAAGRDKDMTDEEFFAQVQYPVIATPKLDGIRCVTMPGGAQYENQQCQPVCRSLDPVPNDWIHKSIAIGCPPGLDGEIITYSEGTLFDRVEKPRPFYQVQSDVMGRDGYPVFRFHVFDYHDFSDEAGRLRPYCERLHWLATESFPKFVELVPHKTCHNELELELYEAEQVGAGYEGICFRTFDSPYKYGRSTLKQGWLVKMKRFLTAEARVVGFYEERHNANPAMRNALGYQERSTHKVNMRGKGTLGGLIVVDLETGQEFRVGSGFNANQRAQLWKTRGSLEGRLITYKCQPHGAKDLPRIPIFIGFRDRRDM